MATVEYGTFKTHVPLYGAPFDPDIAFRPGQVTERIYPAMVLLGSHQGALKRAEIDNTTVIRERKMPHNLTDRITQGGISILECMRYGQVTDTHVIIPGRIVEPSSQRHFDRQFSIVNRRLNQKAIALNSERLPHVVFKLGEGLDLMIGKAVWYSMGMDGQNQINKEAIRKHQTQYKLLSPSGSIYYVDSPWENLNFKARVGRLDIDRLQGYYYAGFRYSSKYFREIDRSLASLIPNNTQEVMDQEAVYKLVTPFLEYMSVR